MDDPEKIGSDPGLDRYKSSEAPPVKIGLVWSRDLVFSGSTAQGYDIDFDGHAQWGCKPTEALLLSLAGCMAIDVVSILKKMRVPLEGFRMEIRGERQPKPPQYFRAVEMVLYLSGRGIDPGKVDRAVQLSHSTYCSVYHTLRKDLEVTVRTVIEEPTADGAG